MIVREGLKAAADRIAAVSATPRMDAELLLAHVLGTSRAQLLARDREVLGDAAAHDFAELAGRRAAGEPIAYLTGRRGFWTLDLEVTPDVLVPRAETELLVEWALQFLRGRSAPRVADLGTGSGALALALAGERPDARVLATDRSAAALNLARRNAARLRLDVDFALGDWYAACAGVCFELIVSNPPYVAADDPHLTALAFEPLCALTPGGDGMGDLATLIAGAPRFLARGGALLVEHGADQAAAVRALFEAAGFSAVETRRDLAGRERATGGVWA